ncbi:GHKL domain-containing protein [Clostridium sp. CF011]|uniref:sensor histidine kinase n=1 Tax=Clostridium sp. CF011 TaxID=2843318 RepID=UPI001C0C6199|nr:sensor histidine kinase [Clostridium sp. CF011]MBU3093538.1 GHKL domain-containing protein [Clostridium sp. CF011]WAG71726.1 GHKL domain-containing protein [Clostridium sp. CF011]
MILTSIGLFLVAIIILIKDYKTESTKLMAAVCFFSGLGIFAVVCEGPIKEYLVTRGASQEIFKLITYISALLSNIAHYMGPYFMLIYGLSYANIIKKNKKTIYIILFIPSIICFIRFPIVGNYLKTPSQLELYFKQLSIWCVPYILGGAFFIVYSYLKEKSYSIKKYKLVNASIVAPFFIYCALANFILRSFGIDQAWRVYPIVFLVQFTGFIYFAYKYGIFGVRLKFHKYMFVFEDVLQLVSDSVLVLDEKLNIIEVNKAFSGNFLIKDREYNSFYDIMNCSKLIEFKNKLINLIDESKTNNIVKIIEIIIENKSDEKHFEVQTNPIILNYEYFGIVLLFKDITLYKKNLELFKQNQFEVIEKERLLSLNQLIGGIAHNLKTPLLSSAGGIQIIKKNTTKIYESIRTEYIDFEYVTKLMNEVNDWQNRISEYLIYMSDVITTVKGQVKEFEQIDEDKFSIEEVINKIKLFMSYEFKKYNCTLVEKIDISYDEVIKGSINSLLQVFNILLTNAIEASEKNEDENIITLGAYEKNEEITFYVKNAGKKIPTKVQENIFKKMVTTKGNKGTGLGLYISKSIITGRFNGKISFETNDKETTFFVKIPF